MTREEAVEILLARDFYEVCFTCHGSGLERVMHEAADERQNVFNLKRCSACQNVKTVKPSAVEAFRLLGLSFPLDVSLEIIKLREYILRQGRFSDVSDRR